MELTSFQIQLIGALGYFFLANSYFHKSKEKILIVQNISNILLAIHYYLLSGITGALCSIITIIANSIIFIFDKKKGKNKQLLAELLLLFLIITCFTVFYFTQTTISFSEIFPIIATAMVIISFISDSKSLIRGIGLIVAICWFVYGIFFGSISAMVFELIIILSTIISYFTDKK